MPPRDKARPRGRALFFLVAASLSGCEAAWNLANRGLLRKDAAALLAKAGLSAPLECGMVGTTRTGACRTRLTREEAAKVIAALRLEPEGPAFSSDRSREPEAACGRPEPGRRPAAEIHRSGRRAPELRLPNGSAFEYLDLYLWPDSGEACLQLSYSYG